MTARILVVDDTSLNVKLLKAKLEHDYYVVTTADNGFKALKQIETEPPDLVLLDVMMPGMDGFEVCRQIRANPDTANIPVVLVTALSDVKDRVQGLQAGADDFLTKPINDLALMARVRSLLRLKTLMDEWRLREKTALQFSAGGNNTTKDETSIAGSRILLLEDEGGDKNFIEQTMAAHSVQVENVGTISDATSLARTGYYDVVLASLNLANEDALKLCAHMRSDEATRHIPIIFLGAEPDMPKIAKGLDLGGNDYLLRPLDANELTARTRTQLRHKKHYDYLRKNYENSLTLSLVDPLTGAFNRRYVEAHLPRMLDRSRQANKELAVLMVDIDHFKKVNDTHGHAVGDMVLKTVVERLQNAVRPSDLVARLGGEEFLVIMPETPLAMAQMVAERLLKKISGSPVVWEGQAEPLAITVSIGCAATTGNSDTQAALLERADSALYKAKNQGRNQVLTS